MLLAANQEVGGGRLGTAKRGIRLCLQGMDNNTPGGWGEGDLPLPQKLGSGMPNRYPLSLEVGRSKLFVSMVYFFHIQ